MPKLKPKRHEVRVWSYPRKGNKEGKPRMKALPVYGPPVRVGSFIYHESFDFRFYLTLTHAQTGMAVATKLVSPEAARDLAEVLDYLEDWTLSEKCVAKARAGNVADALNIDQPRVNILKLICRLAQR